MTEREKMLSGDSYRSRDEELIEMYWRAREVLHAFNGSIHDRNRMETLRALLKRVAPDVWIEPPFYCEYGEHIQIGSGSYLNVNCFLQDCASITIGESVLIGPGVQVCTASHPVQGSERVAGDRTYVTSAQPVHIGDRVWIGANVSVLGGVSIGDDAVIGAGSVVTGDIPPGVVAYGVPCRVQRATGAGAQVSPPSV